MRRLIAGSALILAVVTMIAVAPNAALAQLPTPPGGGLKPPPAGPVKPYQPVAVTPPQTFTDASFEAFRKSLAGMAQRKDRAALAKVVVARDFFWIQDDKDVAEKNKSGIDILAKAINLDGKDAAGWDILTNAADEPTAEELPEEKGAMCAPAYPKFDEQAFSALLQSTQTDPTEWGYPLANGIEVRAAAQPNAQVVEKLALNFVRVLPDSPPPSDPNAPQFLHVASPSGKTGFIAAETIGALGSDQLCYRKDAGGWKIVGYLGGGAQ